MKFKICISYDGSQVHGWEGVGEFNYIRELLQNAIFSFTNQNVYIICASRTDSGVHAELNVCSFNLNTNLSEYKIRHAMNYFLPDYIRVLSVENSIEEFDARFSAKYRHYKYLIALGKTKHPLLRNNVLFTNLKSFSKLSDMCSLIIGKHNFSSFCPLKTVTNKVRTIEKCYLEEIYIFGQKIQVINLIAKSFLHHQVRNIVGSIIDLEFGHLSLLEIIQSLKTGNKIHINMAPALGLYLHNIIY